ncbi:MAG TPA: PAS domain-containing sensor histidine kinase [Candidatus Binatia bacterium]|nr:PAS domain-containing sensor histidine kinase [Candidatus Binatia bacterium]
MATQLTGLIGDDLSQLAIDLDPQDRERKKAQRVYRLNVIQIPLLRLFGFGLVLLGVLLHNLLLSPSFSWPSFVHLVLIVATYALLSWLLLYLLYPRVKLFDVGVFFLVADVFVWTVAVYFAGGEKSWLFFILMMRVADQVNTSFKRALSFAHLPVLSYGLMLLYISAVEQRWISWPAEVTKMLYIYGANLYIALAARPAEQCRHRTAAAIRLARELILRLTEKSQQLEEANRSLENLNQLEKEIAERKRIEETLLRLSNAVQMSTDSIVITDLEGKIVELNEATLRMYRTAHKEDLVGKSAFELIAPEDREEALAAMAEVLEKESVNNRKYAVIVKDGSTLPVEMNVALMKDAAGNPVGFVGISRDITARQQAEQVLRQAKEAAEAAARAKSEFLATMSHELRTPLSVILGYSELITEGEFGPLSDEQGETLKRIRRNALELHELITSVLDLSRLEAGRLPIDVKEIQVPALLEELKAEVQEAYQHLQLHFRWEVEAELAPISTDPQKLKVVLRNLIGNAVKFTPQGSITVKASAKSGGVEVSVSDTGIGISPDALTMIFEPFRQVNGTATRQYGGTGLGLHIVKRLTELLGGTVTVESEVERGSTFMVWVPTNRNSLTK